MPKEWERSEEQAAYLNALLPKFVQARQDRRVARFINDVYEGWFECWPEELVVFGNDWKEGDSDESPEEADRLSTAIKKRKAVGFSSIIIWLYSNLFSLATIQFRPVAHQREGRPLTTFIWSLEEVHQHV
jgi:hypothetical protein